MSDISLISPTIGLTSIDRQHFDPGTAERRPDYTPTGKPVEQSVRKLYDQQTLKDVALDLTVMTVIDPDLLQRQNFEAALLNAYDKVAEHAARDPGATGVHDTLKGLTEASKQFSFNTSALNQI